MRSPAPNATTERAPGRLPGRTAPPEAYVERETRPVVWWAALGGLFLLMFPLMWIPWLTSGNATPTPTGPTDVPGWMSVSAWVHVGLGFVLCSWCVYVWVVKPRRQGGTVGLDALLCGAMMLMYWQDMLVNSFGLTFTYNSTFANFGSWANYLPFWHTAEGNLFSEPIFFIMPMYVVAQLPPIVFANYVMRRVRERRPAIRKMSLVLVAFAVLCVLDVLAETLWLRLGMYTYLHPIKELTIFYGHYYQYPLYEAVLFGGMLTAFAAMRFFRNDKGQTIVERGTEKLGGSTRRKNVIRLLALSGALNLAFLVYNASFGLLHANGDPWPKDITSRSYFTNNFPCGPETYPCGTPQDP